MSVYTDDALPDWACLPFGFGAQPKMNTNAIRASGVALLTAILLTSAHAVVLDSTTTARLNFDFSSSSVPPPYDNMLFHFNFGLSDDFGNGDAFSVQAFSSSGSEVSGAVEIASAIGQFSGGGLEGTFSGHVPVGSFRSMAESAGYLQLTGIRGSFDLTSFWVLANNQSLWPTPSTGWVMYPSGAEIQVTQIASPVPEPDSIAMAIAGLGMVICAPVLFRRKLARRAASS